MATAHEWVIQQAIVDVQYKRGFLFLDRCGSVLHALEDALGKPFVGVVETMTHGELRSPSERLVVTYGSKSYSVTQNWCRMPTRAEQLSPVGWGTVADMLQVGRTVTRIGARFRLVIPTDTIEEARERFTRSSIGKAAGDGWASLASKGQILSAAVTIEGAQRGRTTRTALEVMEMRVEGELPESLSGMIPKCGFLLDVDNVNQTEDPMPLGKTELREFFRTSWQQTRDIARIIQGQLGMGEDAT
jgi:hypothetical protein